MKKQKIITFKNAKGLRFVINNEGKLIDQYGRIFETDKQGKPTKTIGTGYATH